MWSAKATSVPSRTTNPTRQQGVRLYLKETQYDSDKGDLFSARKGTELESNDVRKPFYRVPFSWMAAYVCFGEYNYMNRRQPPIEFKETLNCDSQKLFSLRRSASRQNGQEDPAQKPPKQMAENA